VLHARILRSMRDVQRLVGNPALPATW